MKYIKPVVEIINIENEDIVTISDGCVVGVTLGANCTSRNGLCSAAGGKSNQCDGPNAIVGDPNYMADCTVGFFGSKADGLTGNWGCASFFGTSTTVNGTKFTCYSSTGGTCDYNLGAN